MVHLLCATTQRSIMCDPGLRGMAGEVNWEVAEGGEGFCSIETTLFVQLLILWFTSYHD